MYNRFIFILTFFIFSNYSLAEKLTFDVGRNFYISCSNNQVETNNFGKVELKCRDGNRTVFTFDSLCLSKTEPISFRYKVYFNNDYWNVFIDRRIINETCVIGKNTKLGFQTFHLFSLNPGDSTKWVEMHQLDKNVQIVSETKGIIAKDEFYDAHIYQEIKRNFNHLFFCRSNDFSAIYVFDCKKANSFSLPSIDGMFSVNNNPFSYFAYSSNRYYLLLDNYKTLHSASASSHVNYSVWNDFILAEVGEMATFYQKKENNWNDWSDSLCKDPNFLIFYSKDKIECVSKTNYLFSLKKSEFSDVFIVSDELIVIDSLKKGIQIYSAESNEKFAYQLSKKYVFDREGKQLFINKRKRRVKRLIFENGKFEIENLSK
jgi:hypothetical protein